MKTFTSRFGGYVTDATAVAAVIWVRLPCRRQISALDEGLCGCPPEGDGPESGAAQAITQRQGAGGLGGPARWRSERADFLGLGALLPPPGGVGDPLVLLQATEAVSLDGGVMDEHVGGPVVGGDKAVALVGVEPLDSGLQPCPSPVERILREARACPPG